jgi:hypothetical protein
MLTGSQQATCPAAAKGINMGDEYDRMEALADEYSAGLTDAYGRRKDGTVDPLADETLAASHPVEDEFDTADEFDAVGDEQPVKKKEDPARPEAKRGRYTLPNPESGKSKSWQRVTNFIKLAEDTYHLELWKQRNVAKGLAMRPDYVEAVVPLDVKADKDRLNRICERAQDIAGAYKLSDEGTALHTSTELADYADGSLAAVPDRHKVRVQLYLDALRANGLRVAPGMIERVTASTRYEVAGKFDRVYQLEDGSYVIGDLKTGDSLDLSFPSIAGQLACYEDGINHTGIFTGQTGPAGWDTSLKVRTDFGIVVHLPSTREEVTVYQVSLDQGHELNAVCLRVRNQRRIKAKHVAQVFQADAYRAQSANPDQDWLEELNAAHTVAQLVSIADRARVFGQWNERLADQARLLAAELTRTEAGMGS